jgi:NAD(P)-dependent dehydrogenase (short-subunit alcohol dehydrogenase family)
MSATVSSPAADTAGIFSVAGRSVIVTGATGAFGAAAARAFAQAGALLTISAGNAAGLTALANGLREAGGNVAVHAERPDSPAAAQAIVDAATGAFGGVDVLVVGSGTNDVALIGDMALERWEAVMDANVRGSWLMCQAAGRAMLRQARGGKVILVSSTRGKLGHPAGYAAYCPSKSAVDGLVRALACEWGPHKINVNAIAPTVFRSNLTAWMFSDEERGRAARAGILARIPLGRLGEPEDLVGALLFLSSRASDFCTGQVLYVDGGYTAG